MMLKKVNQDSTQQVIGKGRLTKVNPLEKKENVTS